MADLVTPSASFWSGKRVLVFGHTGFKGAWLSLYLRTLGAQVTGLSLAAETPSLFAESGLDRLVGNRYADIRDLAAVRSVVQEIQPELVFHLAAQALVLRSYKEPVETYATNVMGTVHVLAAASEVRSVRAVVVVTSDKCYENREWLWAYREDEPLGGHDPYSSSKACAELVTNAWRSSYAQAAGSIGIASARAGNVIGGGDWATDRLVPDCFRALASGEPIAIRNPASTRPWQHVLDALCGYLLLAERLAKEPVQFGEGWNFGPVEADVRQVAWIADRIVATWGGAARWSQVSGAAFHEKLALKVDASKARARLGWRQRLRLEEGLRWTVDWYKQFLTGSSALSLTQRQIDDYGKLSTEL